MAIATFDTLTFANTLKAAGVPEKQAEAQASPFSEVIQGNFKELASKNDVERSTKSNKTDLEQTAKDIRRELHDVRDELKREIADVRDELKREIADVRDELKNEIGLVRDDFKRELKEEALKTHAKIDMLNAKTGGELALLKWMIGINTTLLVGIAIRVFFYKLL